MCSALNPGTLTLKKIKLALVYERSCLSPKVRELLVLGHTVQTQAHSDLLASSRGPLPLEAYSPKLGMSWTEWFWTYFQRRYSLSNKYTKSSLASEIPAVSTVGRRGPWIWCSAFRMLEHTSPRKEISILFIKQVRTKLKQWNMFISYINSRF